MMPLRKTTVNLDKEIFEEFKRRWPYQISKHIRTAMKKYLEEN